MLLKIDIVAKYNGLYYYFTRQNMSDMNIPKQKGFKGQKVIVLPTEVIGQVEQDPWINDLFVTDIGFYPDAVQHFRERPSGSLQHILIYCIRGKGWVRIHGQDQSLRENQYIIIPRNLPHQYGADPHCPWSIYWVHFKGEKADYFAQACQGPLNIPASEYSRLRERISLFDEMYLNLEMGYSTENLYYVNMVLWHFLSSFLFIQPFRQINRVHEMDPLGETIRYMKENLDHSFSLEHFATRVNYSPSHFITLFKQKTGYSPIEYFIHLKMQRACQYLDMTGLRIKEIAGKLGFSDPYYFSRTFSRRIGISPRQYRNNKKG